MRDFVGKTDAQDKRKWIRVGVFPLSETSSWRLRAYTLRYNPASKDCCEHDVFAVNGTEAKKMAIGQHKSICLIDG